MKAMVINVIYNSRSGLGGGTRHLHQFNYGDEIGSTHDQRISFYPGKHLRVGMRLLNGLKTINANDNFAGNRVAAAA